MNYSTTVFEPMVSSSEPALGFVNESEYCSADFMSGIKQGQNWSSKLVRTSILTKPVKPKYFIWLSGCLACTETTWEILESYLRNEVEPLKVHTTSNTIYYILNVICVPENSIDMSKSKKSVDPFSGVNSFFSYRFNDDVIKDFCLFRLKEDRNALFCTRKFKNLLENLNMETIDFRPVRIPKI
jgi:hypothetical protein